MTEVIKKLDKLSDGHTEILKEQVKQNTTLEYMGEKVGKMDLKIDHGIAQRDELSDKMIEIDNKLLRIDSWKNGQIEYQKQQNEFRLDILKRVPPLEMDLETRLKISTDTRSHWKSIGWKFIEILSIALVITVILVIGASMVSGGFWTLFSKLIQ